MSSRNIRQSILMILLITMTSVKAGDIVFSVEEPTQNGKISGISNIRGWAISTAGIDRVELRINGVYK